MKHTLVSLRSTRFAAIAMLIPLFGCTVALDLFDPSFFAGLGLDTNAITPATGVVVVSFTNNTGGFALFSAYETESIDDLSLDTRNFTVAVESGESRNEVLYCPVGAISFGTVGADFAVDNTAANITFDEGGTDVVAYGGSPLVSGRDYSCGDLIDVTVTPGTDGALALTVQVRRGR